MSEEALDPQPKKRLARSGKRGRGPAPKARTRAEVAILRMPARYKDFLDGTLSPADMTMEELERGQLMDVNGGFNGGPPSVVPIKFYQAMRVEYQRRLEQEYRPMMRDAYEALHHVAVSPGQAGVARVNAAKELLDRLGTPVGQKVDITMEIGVKPLFEQVLDLSIDLDPPKEIEDVVDAEIVEDDL